MGNFVIGLIVGAVAASIVGGGFALWAIVRRLDVICAQLGSVVHAIHAAQKANIESTDQ